MFLFAHIGITVGAATLIAGAVDSVQLTQLQQPDLFRSPLKQTPQDKVADSMGLTALSRFLDIRILMIGALFPDIIDKPLEFVGFGNGRSITHTLLVTVIVVLASLWLYFKSKKTWLMAIAFGMCTHLVLDQMWLTPHVLLWPSQGWAFPHFADRIGLLQFRLWWSALTSNRTVITTECIGASILGLTALAIGQKKIQRFILLGTI
jgi:membrane-bound metal-dependent hydrolase YbcI (DUF457 family)